MATAQRLYRDTHPTFEDYCRERWGMSRRYANRQIEAAGVAETLTPIGAIPNEAQARELAPLKNEPEQIGGGLTRRLVPPSISPSAPGR